MTAGDLLLLGLTAGAVAIVWYLVGTYGGILWTRRSLTLLALTAGLALGGAWWPAALDLMLVVDLVLVCAVWADTALAPRPGRKLQVDRDVPPAFSMGHAGEVTYQWRNAYRRRARLRVREVRPEVLGGIQTPRTVSIPPSSTQRDSMPVLPLRRGHETAGELTVDSLGPLGLGTRRTSIALPWEVRVYPSLTSLRRQAAVAEALRRRELGRRRYRRLGEGRLFESLREFVPGDDPRHIDWKASARRGKMILRQFEAERRQQVLLVLDAGRLMTAAVAGVARMDYVVQAALELSYAAAQHDDNVGIMVFADGVRHYVAPQRGRRGLKPVLDVLSEVTPSLVEPDYPGAFRYLAARNRKRALTVVFTDVIDRFASEALVANLATLRPRHLPVAVTLRNPELDGLSALRPRAVRDAWRKAAAEDLLEAREEALSHMRRAGVLVLDVPPQQAAEAVVTRYLDLKRRGRL